MNTDEKPQKKLSLDFSGLGELSQIESLIRSTFISDSPLMKEIPEYFLALGGKRIRPALTLLVARALSVDPIPNSIIEVASGIELIHMATLLHDDIIDNSPLRRHKPSPLAVYGIPNTLLSGDFLLTRAFGLCARLDREIIRETELSCIELVEGESLETPLYSSRHTRESSLTIAKKKTAALFRLGAFSAAHIAGASLEVKHELRVFGESIGIAFQILDDILDIASDEATLGKKPGTDLRERKPSFVNIVWLETGAPLSKRLEERPDEDDERWIAIALEELKSGEVLANCRKVAVRYATTARNALQTAARLAQKPNASAFAELDQMVSFTLERLT